MEITLEYYGSHARHAGVEPGVGIQKTFSGPCSIGTVLGEMGIEEDTVIVSVNSVISKIGHLLHDGDTLAVFDIMEGG